MFCRRQSRPGYSCDQPTPRHLAPGGFSVVSRSSLQVLMTHCLAAGREIPCSKNAPSIGVNSLPRTPDAITSSKKRCVWERDNLARTARVCRARELHFSNHTYWYRRKPSGAGTLRGLSPTVPAKQRADVRFVRIPDVPPAGRPKWWCSGPTTRALIAADAGGGRLGSGESRTLSSCH